MVNSLRLGFSKVMWFAPISKGLVLFSCTSTVSCSKRFVLTWLPSSACTLERTFTSCMLITGSFGAMVVSNAGMSGAPGLVPNRPLTRDCVSVPSSRPKGNLVIMTLSSLSCMYCLPSLRAILSRPSGALGGTAQKICCLVLIISIRHI